MSMIYRKNRKVKGTIKCQPDPKQMIVQKRKGVSKGRPEMPEEERKQTDPTADDARRLDYPLPFVPALPNASFRGIDSLLLIVITGQSP